MHELTSHASKAINTVISSSWAIFVAATVALFLFFYGDRIGLDRQRLDLHFLVDAATFLMVFVIEHTQSREPVGAGARTTSGNAHHGDGQGQDDVIDAEFEVKK